MSALSPEQLRIFNAISTGVTVEGVRAYIAANWKNACPLCGSRAWHVDEPPMNVTTMGVGATGLVYPTVPVVCTQCGTLQFIALNYYFAWFDKRT